MGKYYDRNGGISTPADKQFAVVVMLVLCLLVSYPREIFILVLSTYVACLVGVTIAAIISVCRKSSSEY